KDAGGNLSLTAEAAAAVAAPAPPASPAPSRGAYRPVRARTAIQNDTPVEVLHAEQRHVVAEGETLFSLAERYYGEKAKFAEIYLFNRERVEAPDSLTPGTVLVIPQLPAR